MKQPYRVLVLQMAKLGDTLQTLMALKAAKQLYPELEITFVAREQFAKAAQSVSWINQVVTFPSGEIISEQSISRLASWLSPLVDEPWDMLLNWTYNDSSSFLSTLIPAHVKLGFSRKKDGSISCEDGWSCYVQGIVQSNIEQGIHLTDILTTQLLTALQIHIGEPQPVGQAAVTSRDFFSLSDEAETESAELLDSSKKWIAIQLGTGNEAKTVSPELLALFAKQILKSQPNYRIVLLGTEANRELEQRFMDRLIESESNELLAQKVISAVGFTSFDLWASIVGRSQWVIAGDTAVIHLASVLGVRVLNISVGPVRFLETGPYGNGHYVMRGAEIPVGDLVSTWNYANTEWTHQRKSPLSLEKALSFRSRIRSSEDGGGVVFEAMGGEPLTLNLWYASVLGDIARTWLCGWVPEAAKELKRSQISSDLSRELRQLRESTVVLHQIYDEAIRTAEQLTQKTQKLKSDRLMSLADKDEVQKLGLKLQELDQLVVRLAAVHPAFEVFVNMSVVMMHNLNGEKLSDLGDEAARVYRQLMDGVIVLNQWIDRTQEIAKPEIVVSSEKRRGHLRLVKNSVNSEDTL